MKILHATLQLFGGGLEVYLHEIIRRLAAAGHESVVLHGRVSGAPPMGLPSDVPARAHHVPGVTDIDCAELPRRLAEVRDILRDERPDVILMHKVFQHRLVRLLADAAPMVRFVHDVQPVCPEGRKTLNRGTASGGPELCPHPMGWACQARAYVHRCMPRDPRRGLPLLRHLLANLALHRAGTPMVCPSVFIRDMLVQNGFDPARVTVLPHFTQVPSGPPAALPAADHQAVLFAGRVHSGKGLDVLLRAVALLPPRVVLDVAGDGPDLEQVKSLARDLDLAARVRFHGWLPCRELASLYSTASVVAVPSLCREAFCMAGIEAMAHGRPVVGADSGGVSEWLDHGVTGFLVPPGDVGALAARLGEVLSSTELALKLGKAGRERVESHFTPDRHVLGLVGLLERTAREG